MRWRPPGNATPTTITLEQINDGYRDMLEGGNVRGILRYTDADRG
ncbi:MAG: hypothetical protein VX424_07510 [Actinomycetota bacterium]|nr:hypothetical protein [Actinomycetota bacterium]